ncbi:pyrroloquinoline quinone precursor peptide PqqA [Kutzneria buriramensis]|uniref:Coenzyme PQQ synthesis protein A n=1 Tax=Kutzneria buriramensis TaxID=1045776 RepID=A0A3E0HHE0_9PSEU|nr:pyrroloquinoline quinone precursor peptide PqqA [Kutzneria buriramensis]REH45871.1 coenzyme PQQ precursor peptide PqqA [Kutzneria buriramensis]
MSARKIAKPARRPAPVRKSWVKPDFRDYDTPMEVTAYAARA